MTVSDRSLQRALHDVLHRAVAAGAPPGAVCQIIRGDAPALTVTAGHLATFDDAGAMISVDAQEPVSRTTIYDLASVSKIVTSITMLSLVDDGTIALDAEVAGWLPAFRTPEKSTVTLAHLLSHTSGLPPTNPYTLQRAVQGGGTARARWVAPDRSAVLGDILSLPLERPVGADKVYSCLGYIASMALAEAAASRGWSDLVRDRALNPLGLTRTTFTPDRACTASTEYQPLQGRGMVRGVVHDETACALGGAAGNAGLFAPVDEVSALGSAIMAGLPGVLTEESFSHLWDDQLPRLLGRRATDVEARLGYGQSLGLRLAQESWMGSAGALARGHTGFTGTSLLVDHAEQLVVVLLTNRVHPDRGLFDVTGLRRTVHEMAYAG